MIQRLWNYKGWLFLNMLCSLLSSVFYVLTPLFLGKAIDNMVGVIEFSKVVDDLSLVLLFYGLQFIFTWLANGIANHIATTLVTDLRQALAIKLNHVPIAYLDGHSQGDLQNLFANDSELVLEGVYQLITQLMGGLFIVILVIFFMLQISGLMSVVVILTVPFVFIPSRFISKQSGRLFRQQQEIAGRLTGRSGEFIDNERLLMTYNYQEQAEQEINDLNDQYVAVSTRALFLSSLVNPTTRAINNLQYVLVGLVGAFAMWNFGLTIGGLTSFISYTLMFSRPFNEFSAVMTQITPGLAAYKRIEAMLHIENEKDVSHELVLKGDRIQFQAVDFSYDDHPLLQDLNLDIAPLSKVAIVGPTGAGKSTLINLLMRFYDPKAGRILVDEWDVRDMSRTSVREVMGLVLQDPWLFAGTIRDNLKYGRDDASDEDLYEALRQANCYEMVMELDEGLDTLITLGSQNISLGQKQLLTIARALVVQAPILILDEATSSVDALTEKRIQQVFTTIMKSHTSFFIAHRLATVVDSTVILVMRDGRIVEQGTHESLMQAQGFYYELYMSQYSV